MSWQALSNLYVTKYFCIAGFTKNREPTEGILESCQHTATTLLPHTFTLGMTHITIRNCQIGPGRMAGGGGMIVVLDVFLLLISKDEGLRGSLREGRRGESSGCLYGRIFTPPTHTTTPSTAQPVHLAGQTTRKEVKNFLPTQPPTHPSTHPFKTTHPPPPTNPPTSFSF